MQLNMNITHQQVAEHLLALRQEAAQARLVSRQPNFLIRALRFLTPRSIRPAAPRNSVRHT